MLPIPTPFKILQIHYITVSYNSVRTGSLSKPKNCTNLETTPDSMTCWIGGFFSEIQEKKKKDREKKSDWRV
jgi:hypothetical protein